MFIVTAYTIWNTKKRWKVESRDKGREFAKRMIIEGLWYVEGKGDEVFVPPHNLMKVRLEQEDK